MKTTYNVILLAEILAYNKSALYRSASPAFSFVLTYSYWHFASEPAWWAKKGAGRGRGTTTTKKFPQIPPPFFPSSPTTFDACHKGRLLSDLRMDLTFQDLDCESHHIPLMMMIIVMMMMTMMMMIVLMVMIMMMMVVIGV